MNVWLGWVFAGAHRLSLIAASRDYALSECGGFSCCGSRALGCTGFITCGVGFTALQHVESSQTSDPTCVPYIGRRILNRWTTREVQKIL